MDTIIDQSIEICKDEFKKEKNKKILEDDILNPIIKYIGNRLWPYILYLLLFTLCLLIILFYIIYIVNKKVKE